MKVSGHSEDAYTTDPCGALSNKRYSQSSAGTYLELVIQEKVQSIQLEHAQSRCQAVLHSEEGSVDDAPNAILEKNLGHLNGKFLLASFTDLVHLCSSKGAGTIGLEIVVEEGALLDDSPWVPLCQRPQTKQWRAEWWLSSLGRGRPLRRQSRDSYWTCDPTEKTRQAQQTGRERAWLNRHETSELAIEEAIGENKTVGERNTRIPIGLVITDWEARGSNPDRQLGRLP
ncbi:hypothetical protein T265_10939 [Opisthorchis viverrini]|uniref:Uncharacterized protein n=1 Tax=Opisthorchis viverrini TaxID=6198 RepID=A0A074Z0Q3_OPIVI|nr:hypothetical protein T265_10939 [Opisthorchis viverrini]KER20538.1 hypothetical protein T265_10939 [Opisthorchis viverrini]